MYSIEYVDRLPQRLGDAVVYVSEEFEIAALKCACGCGHQVNLLLGDGHQVLDVGGFADVSPSIGVWDASCRSHFFIKRGRVVWAGKWSDEYINRAMNEQVARHVDSSEARSPWYKLVWQRIRKWWS